MQKYTVIKLEPVWLLRYYTKGDARVKSYTQPQTAGFVFVSTNILCCVCLFEPRDRGCRPPILPVQFG